MDTRAHYLSLGISPKVSCQGGPITALHIPLWKQHVFVSKPYAHNLWEWSQVLLERGYGVPYCGESLSIYTHAVIMALVKNKRRQVTAACRKNILAKHKNRCAKCGDLGDAHSNVLELDHPTPLRDHGADDPQGLVPLCAACHSHKSYLENLTPFQANPHCERLRAADFRSLSREPQAEAIHPAAALRPAEGKAVGDRLQALPAFGSGAKPGAYPHILAAGPPHTRSSWAARGLHVSQKRTNLECNALPA